MTKRILIAGFRHETNTFSKLPTDMAAFEARSLHRGAEIAAAYRGTKTEVAAFFDACERHDWTPVPVVMADATPSGKVTRAAFEAFTAEILAALDEGGPVDGLFLPLHGAMVTEHADDGEGALLEALRAKVGRGLPIAVTLDLHANVTETMANLADILVSYRTYPHVDQYEIATEAADLLARRLAGEIAPGCTVARGAMLDGADHGRTTAPGPMTEVLERAARFRKEPGVLSISINAGFPWADIPFAGPTAVVVGDGPSPRYAEIAEALIREIWDKRRRRTIAPVSVAAAMAAVAAAGSGAAEGPPEGPVVLADYADNPGGGGYGDSVDLLGGMIAAGLENAAYATIYDPEAAALCTQAGAGAEVTLSLGGKVEPRFGAPLEVTGTVKRLTDGRLTFDGPMNAGVSVAMGPTAVLAIGGIDVVVTSGRFQVYDRQYLKHAGIDPAEKSVVAVKSAHHFRAAFAPLARQIVVVDGGGGLTSANFKELPFEKLRRPIYPLDLE
ncbi:MAG: M81 family metallopeptidase [Proteobacteria bacterium]|nr:M81 family metallopeptidase [Pseudomonadota bacterium]